MKERFYTYVTHKELLEHKFDIRLCTKEYKKTCIKRKLKCTNCHLIEIDVKNVRRKKSGSHG